MTVGIWRDIQEKWEEILEQTGNARSIPLMAGDAPGLWVFVWGEGPQAGSDAWLKDVAGYGKRRSEHAVESA